MALDELWTKRIIRERGANGYDFTHDKLREVAYTQTSAPQRRLLHRVSASAARPGDLVFYLSGGSAYHVAIYAGHHMQYAAATVRDGIRYQQVWSSAVVYGHLG